jgi:AcrR family transcriptional regulator
MNRIGQDAARPYHSALREQQAEATRGRILDAAVAVMYRGVASLSIPAVAREAGVSVPTVYRYFGTKAALLASLYPHLARRLGLDQLTPPRTLSELREGMRVYLERLDGLGEAERFAMASPAAEEVRGATMSGRLAAMQRLVDSIDPPPAERDRARLVRLLAVLTRSGSLRMWRDHLGVSVDQAVDDIDWIMRAAVAASEREGS